MLQIHLIYWCPMFWCNLPLMHCDKVTNWQLRKVRMMLNHMTSFKFHLMMILASSFEWMCPHKQVPIKTEAVHLYWSSSNLFWSVSPNVTLSASNKKWFFLSLQLYIIYVLPFCHFCMLPCTRNDDMNIMIELLVLQCSHEEMCIWYKRGFW